MKKRFMFLICACLSGVIAHAVTYPYLTFQKADGTVVSMGVESLTMTFSDGKLFVSNGTDTHTLTVSELSSMYFSATDATGIKEVPNIAPNAELEVFDIQGVNLGNFPDLQTMKAKVKPGMYVVKANGKTQKIAFK